MNKTIAHQIRLYFQAQLAPETGTGMLIEHETAAVSALYSVLTGDRDYDTGPYLVSLHRRTATVPGLIDRFRSGIALIQRLSQQKFGRTFQSLEQSQQNAVLASVLSGNVSPMSEPAWRYRFRVSRWHFDQIFCSQPKRAFRQFVSADILSDYYRGQAGWESVGYREYPGKVRGDWEPCEVLQAHFDGEEILLELSDSTFDRLLPDALEMLGDDALVAVTKHGRQRARLSRSAYNTITEHLEEDGDSMVIRRGQNVWKLRMGVQ